MDLGQRGDWVKLDRVGGGDTVRMYCMREEYIFNKIKIK